MTLPKPDWNHLLTDEQRARVEELVAEDSPRTADLIFREVLTEMNPPEDVTRVYKNGRLDFYEDYMAVLLSRKLAAEGI